MRALHLFLTITLSLSATAYDDFLLQRRDSVPVDGTGIYNRGLSVLNMTNTDSKRALDDDRLMPRRFTSGKMKLTLKRGLFTGPVSFDGQLVPGTVFDTGESRSWARFSKNSILTKGSVVFEGLGVYTLHGIMTKYPLTVELMQGLASRTQFTMVGGQDSDSYGFKGGLALNRSPTSWLNTLINRDQIQPIFGFLSLGVGVEFHFGEIDPKLAHIEWHTVAPGDAWTIADKAHVQVHVKGEPQHVENVEEFTITIDTGRPYIYGGPSDVMHVYKQVPNSKHVQLRGHGYWMVPCDEHPLVSISWGNRAFRIEDFLMYTHSAEEDGKKYCRGSLRTRKSLPPNTMVFGVRFLYDKFTGFRNGEIGFTPLRAPSSP